MDLIRQGGPAGPLPVVLGWWWGQNVELSSSVMCMAPLCGGSSHKPLDSPNSLGQFSTEVKCNMFLIFLDHFTRLILEKAVCVVCRSTFKSS